MDSPIVSQLFRQLFCHRTCSRLRSHSSLPFRTAGAPRTQSRKLSSTGARYDDASKNESHWQQRTELFPPDKSKDFERYPMMTADALRSRKERPRRVKMLARDFIEGKTPSSPWRPLVLRDFRQSIQPPLRILLQTSRHLQPWRPLRLQQHAR